MQRKIISLILAAVILPALLAGCSDPPVETFPGEFDIPYSLGERFTISIISTTDEYRRFKWAVVDVTLEVNDEKILSTFDAKIHRIRGIVTGAINAKPIEQLLLQKEAIQQGIMEDINREFNTEAVQRVVFGDFYFA